MTSCIIVISAAVAVGILLAFLIPKKGNLIKSVREYEIQMMKRGWTEGPYWHLPREK